MTKATIGDGVTTIGQEAFSGCKLLTTATLGSEVRTIGYRAFFGCAELSEIVLPDNVTELTAKAYSDEAQTFADCVALTKLTIGKKLAKTVLSGNMEGALKAFADLLIK